MLYEAVFLIGLSFISYQLYRIISIFVSGNSKVNVQKRYGPGWVIVTGATDGIGKGFCQVLAKENFNICVVGRNEEKTKKVCQELISENPKIKAEPIIADFVNCLKNENFSNDLKTQLKQKIGSDKVSILVNNVGIEYMNSQRNKPLQEVNDLIAVNCGSQVAMTKLVLDEFMKSGANTKENKQRQAIINLSSVAAGSIMPYDSDYSASKAFNERYSQGLSYELKNDNIDVLAIKPLFVTTAMTGYLKSSGAISPKACAQGALNQLGLSISSSGHRSHRLQSLILSYVPMHKFADFLAKRHVKMLKRRERKAQQQQKKE